MKNLFLSKLELRNFAGIRHFVIDFSSLETNILGRNGSGKTTLFDAYNWLLFGKDSMDRTDFPIKTYDSMNKTYHKLEHSVEGIIIQNENPIELKRVYTEKWTRKRGNDIEELTGHETTFYINGVEKKKNEYEAFIKELIDEQISKVITNPVYFMEKMKWNERREVLSKMAGEITNENVLEQFGFSEQLKELLLAGKNLAEQKQIYNQKIKLLKDQLQEIETRLKEANYSDVEQIDFEAVENQIHALQTQISAIESNIIDLQKANATEQQKVIDAQNEKFKLNTKVNELKNELSNKNNLARNEILTKRMDIEREITHFKNQIENVEIQRVNIQSNIEALQNQNNELRSKFNEITNRTFQLNPNDITCPTCKRQIENPETEIQKIQTKFNTQKAAEIEPINVTGTQNKSKIEALQVKLNELNITDLQSKLEAKQLELQNFNQNNAFSELLTTPEIEQLQKEIDSFITPEIKQNDFSELLDQKNKLQSEIDALKKQLAVKDEIQRREKRIVELTNDSKLVAHEMAQLQKIDSEIDKFNETKMDIVQKRVNSLFKIVKFKMFNTQINGGIDPTCEAIVDGKPYAAMNKALQMNVGIDIVNALNKFYNVYAPIFIDNRESVTTLIKSDSQIINLIVDKDCEVLTVESI
jgi:DNA repair exonuclease SbcCD ATPase subunit